MAYPLGKYYRNEAELDCQASPNYYIGPCITLRGYRDFKSPRARIADFKFPNAVRFSFACTTKRSPSPRCASATKIVQPWLAVTNANRADKARFIKLPSLAGRPLTEKIFRLASVDFLGSLARLGTLVPVHNEVKIQPGAT